MNTANLDNIRKSDGTGRRFFKKKRVLVLSVVLILVVWQLISFLVTGSQRQGQALNNLTTLQLEKQRISRTLLLSGTVNSQNSRQVYAPSSLKVLEVLVKKGEHVSSGQVLAKLDTADLEMDIRTARLNLLTAMNSKETAGIEIKNTISTNAASLKAAKLELDSAQRQYKEARREAESNPNAAVQTAKAELEIASRQYSTAKSHAEGNTGAAGLSVKTELAVAERTYEQLYSQGERTENVATAQKELETAQRVYNSLQAQSDNTAAVKSARSELNAAVNKYTQLKQNNVSLSVRATQNRYNTAIEAHRQAQSNPKLNQAANDLQNAQRNYNEAVTKYEAGRSVENPDGDPALQEVVKQNLAIVSEKQAAVTAATEEMKQSIKSAEESMKSAELEYKQSVESSDDNLEQARLAIERAQISYDSAVAAAGEGLINSRDSLDKAQQAYDHALKASRDALGTAKDTLQRAQNAYSSAVSGTQDTLTTAKDSLERANINYESALKNQSDAYTTANTALQRAENSYSSAKLSLQASEQKTVEAAQLSIDLQQVTLDKLNKQLTDAVLLAPISGTVTFSNSTAGQFATGLMFVVEDADHLTVTTTVGESDIGVMQLGQQAVIKTDGTAEEEFKAQVGFLASAADKTATGETSGSTNVQFAAKVDLIQADPRIRIGMNARMNIVLQEKDNVFAVPIEAVVNDAQGEAIYVRRADKLQKLPVASGIQNDILVEITAAALEPGMIIEANGQAAAELLATSPSLRWEE
ncbi:HlyD family efflux transporter periplasmic adaptor subunit [Paenibacillus sp. MMS20-IR301]|uniref:HlyD family efflux transporter periplasmic adaptor subunit n=1 Tax=Paenibacillus sp. MMS20-IR301 TaxID=2895946 RepID=UPI0028EEFFD4|nr:HlyD family efflux transporter periplasmic adaptor subunit [Paenibacillus sp. MMS20-IR301]WNS45209.1 HlyD family efflux transporter periplasmic adaptor subunit [Paenibacillus sp. MMS20-IR301]